MKDKKYNAPVSASPHERMMAEYAKEYAENSLWISRISLGISVSCLLASIAALVIILIAT